MCYEGPIETQVNVDLRSAKNEQCIAWQIITHAILPISVVYVRQSKHFRIEKVDKSNVGDLRTYLLVEWPLFTNARGCRLALKTVGYFEIN